MKLKWIAIPVILCTLEACSGPKPLKYPDGSNRIPVNTFLLQDKTTTLKETDNASASVQQELPNQQAFVDTKETINLDNNQNRVADYSMSPIQAQVVGINKVNYAVSPINQVQN